MQVFLRPWLTRWSICRPPTRGGALAKSLLAARRGRQVGDGNVGQEQDVEHSLPVAN